ncbi:MAG: DUF934 domain-containing protein [Granulosicoccaceae bacterium]
MRQLFENGDVVELSERDALGSICIPADTPIADIDAEQLAQSVLLLEFASFADGRGFSLAKILKRTLPPSTQVVATGTIIPDQLELAWQCGFDSAIISEELWLRCGPNNWRAQL